MPADPSESSPLDSTLALAAAFTASGDDAARAFGELAATLAEIESEWIGPERGMHTDEERAAARSLLAHALQHGFQVWFTVDPARPLFHRWLSQHVKKKLGG